jgi:hypothetical protein
MNLHIKQHVREICSLTDLKCRFGAENPQSDEEAEEAKGEVTFECQMFKEAKIFR